MSMGGIPWSQTGTTQYHLHLGLPDKGHIIKGLVVCNNRDLEPLDLQNGLALGCYQLSPEVLIVYEVRTFRQVLCNFITNCPTVILQIRCL